jgi:hypothetical protein
MRVQGRGIPWRPVDEQTGKIFLDFTLMEDWIGWVINSYFRKASISEAVQKRQALQDRLQRARRLYVEGDYTWADYIKIKNETERALGQHVHS